MPWPDTRAGFAVHMAPAMRPRSDFSNSVEATRSAARHAGPSVPSSSPPKVTGRRASSWREEWERRLSRTRSWRRGSCTKCRGCSCHGKCQHHQPSRGVQPMVAAVRSARPFGPVPGGQPPNSQIAWAKTWVTPGRRATRASQGRRSYRVCMTGETWCPFERTRRRPPWPGTSALLPTRPELPRSPTPADRAPGLCARQRRTTCARQMFEIMGNYGELWGIIGFHGELWGNFGELCGIMGNYGVLWGIMGKFCGYMGKYGELWGIMGFYGE